MLAKMQRGPQPYLLAQLQKAQEDNVMNLIWAATASPWWSGDLGHILQIFSLCLWMKTTLCTHKMQTPQPPLLSCKEGKTLRVKLTWKELVMIHLRREGRLSSRLFCTEHKGKEKNTLTNIIFCSLAEIHIHLLRASPMTFVIFLSPHNGPQAG